MAKGYKTSEFWINLVVIVAGILMASGIIEETQGIGQVIGAVCAAVNASVYSAGRSIVKKKEIENK